MDTTITRRTLITTAAAAAALLILNRNSINAQTQGDIIMTTITTTDGTNIFYKDWGPRDAQPIVFHHGWPLSSDDWDGQLLHFLEQGYRVIAHDRRGHGRSDQPEHGHDMETYAQDVVELARALDLKSAIHVGHSTGGGEAARYAAIAEPGRVSKVVLIGAVTPVMAQTASNPEGIPLEVFDGFRASLIKNRAQFYLDIASGPFFGFNREGAEISEGQIRHWYQQGMTGSAKAHYDCIKAFSETDFTEDLQSLNVPVLILHGEDDQLVPIDNTARRAIKMLRNGTLKTYPGLSHAPFATHPDLVNADLLEFARS